MPERIVPTLTNVLVCAGLLGLTLATALLGLVDLDPWNLVVALAIAAAKASLIAFYFMHLRSSAKVTQLAAAGGLLWLAIMLMGVLDDYVTRAWLPIPGK